LPVPTDGWINGGWNNKLPQFRLLAEMLGLNKPSISPEDLQVLFRSVSSAKLFAENVQSFLEATDGSIEDAAKRLEGIEQKLGLLQPLPFMSLRGMADPRKFSGVAIWPAGITNWTQLRLREIRIAQEAGAKFEHIIMLGSSRVCNAPADKRHPLIANLAENGPSGLEPTERDLQQIMIGGSPDWVLFHEPELPEANADGRPLSLEQQLTHLVESGQFTDLIGERPVYVPSTPNSLYVPLHVRRVLGLDNVWFSQAGARLVRGTPDSWWPSLQDVMTIPNGIIRLWVELLHAGCIK
jgi:hypothetical protein